MPPSGRVLFGQMDEVVFGKPAAEAIAAQVHRLGTTRVFLMVSNSLNRNTDEIDKICRALGNRCAGSTCTAAPCSGYLPNAPRNNLRPSP